MVEEYPLIDNAEQFARGAMEIERPDLADRFATIVRFLVLNPAMMPNSKAKNPIGSADYFKALASSYIQAREPNRPKSPATISDPLVSFILNVYFGVKEDQLERAREEHKWAMAAENMVGDLLERYLATLLEPQGWVWCAGSSVRSVDFVKPPADLAGEWVALQIKNRDNSENSSSKAIRDGTQIIHWFRAFSKKDKTNWAAFPDEVLRADLSEDGFRAFLKDYLKTLK